MRTMNDWDIIYEQLKYLEIFKFSPSEDPSKTENFKNPDSCNTCRTYKKYSKTCKRFTC